MKQNRTINLPKLGGELEGSGVTFSYAEIHCQRKVIVRNWPQCSLRFHNYYKFSNPIKVQ